MRVDDELAVLGDHGLVAGGAQVEDREAAKPEPYLIVEVQTRIVGSPVRKALRHSRQDGRICLATAEADHHH